jgi:hypothetical protein
MSPVLLGVRAQVCPRFLEGVLNDDSNKDGNKLIKD